VEGVFLGVDFHVRTQTVSWCDTANGVVERRTLDHRTDDVRAFYQQFHVPAVVGLEATGYARWFHRLMEETGHHLVIGDALRIRQFAARRQKNDRRDSELLLDFLPRGDFPAIHIPSIASQEVLRLLRYRHRLVGMRTMLKNELQAVMLNLLVVHFARHHTSGHAEPAVPHGRLEGAAICLPSGHGIPRPYSRRDGRTGVDLGACGAKSSGARNMRFTKS
jgi:transposase